MGETPVLELSRIDLFQRSETISSSSYCTIRTDLPDSLPPPFSIVHRSREVFQTIFCIGIELYIGSSWSSYFCSSMWVCHKSTSLMNSSLSLQQCPACLVRLTWIVFVMGSKWPYIYCFVECCLQDLFNIARIIFV